MLDKLRHKGTSKKILWFVAVVIILSFGVFGTAYRLDNTLNSAGKIFGHSVALRDFEKAYLDSRDQAIMTYGDRFFKAGQNLDLENETWTRLILLREAQKRRLKASDQEVVEFIAQVPFFQHEGRFSSSTYENIVSNPRVFDRKIKDFEEGVRNSIVIRKLFEQAAGPILVSDDELKKEYIRRNEKIKLSYILFSPQDYNKGLSASGEEAKKFYNEHKEQFRQPAMINVQYAHMLYPAKADDTQKQAVKKDAAALAHDLTPKADFAAIAQKYHTELKESGFFTQDQPLLTFAWSPEFVDKIFTMKPGDIGSPMEAPDGWQIVRIKEKKEAQVPAFADIAAKVQEALVIQKATDAALVKADQVLKDIQAQIKTKDFKAIAEGLGLKTQDTTEFSRGEYINAPGLIAEFQEPSLKLNQDNKISGVVSTSQGPAILYLSGTEAIDEKKFTEDKEDFRQMMTAQQHSQAIAIFVNRLKIEADQKSDLKGKIRYQ